MNVFYWGEAEVTKLDVHRNTKANERPDPNAATTQRLQLQTPTESQEERRAAEEAIVSQWMAERQCSGV